MTVVPSRAGQAPLYRFRGSRGMRNTFALAGGAALIALFGTTVRGQNAVVLQAPGAQASAQTRGADPGEQQGGGGALTLKSAIEMALRNSKDIKIAKLQAAFAPHAPGGRKAGFT